MVMRTRPEGAKRTYHVTTDKGEDVRVDLHHRPSHTGRVSQIAVTAVFFGLDPSNLAMKAVIGEEALSHDDLLYLKFTEKFEGSFVSQSRYEKRTIFDSLDKAWGLLRSFPSEKLSKIHDKIKAKYYRRKTASSTANEGGEAKVQDARMVSGSSKEATKE